MRYSIRKPSLPVLAAILVVSGLAGCAGPQSLQGTAQSAVPGRGNVFAVRQDDGTVLLTGWIEGDIGHLAVLRDIRRRDDVTNIIDRIYVDRF